MAKYESYRTRRLPVNFSGLPPNQAAALRLYAIRDLMRMEMPQGYADVSERAVGNRQPFRIEAPCRCTSPSRPRSAFTRTR